MFWSRLRAFFIPSPGSIVLVWAAFFIFLIQALLFLLISWNEPNFRSSFLQVVSCDTLISVLLVAVATFVEHRPGARFLLWGLTNVIMLFVVLGVNLGNFSSLMKNFQGTVTLLFCCCLPLALLPGALQIYLGWRAWPAFQRMLRAARLQRLIVMVQARGEVTLAEIGNELSLSGPQLAVLVQEMIDLGELMAYFDKAHYRVYSAAALAEKERRLLAAVQVQGRVRVDGIADELHITAGLARQWLSILVQRGYLHGFADWMGGWVYSLDAEQLRQQGRCPHCGGALNMAGKGVIQCEHCGVEVFL